MKRIIGVIPAGGEAKRIHGFFKEMMPIGINENDRSKFVVSSEAIITSMLAGGATSIHFILSADKSFIVDYYAKQKVFTNNVLFNNLTREEEDLGMPYTIDSTFQHTKDCDYVLMGMPDTVIEPADSFKTVLTLLKQRKADLALGLYSTDERNKGGFIRFDPDNNKVLSHVDKTSSKTFPEKADNSWAIACWSKTFTQYMHDFLSTKRKHVRTRPANSELLFGDIIDAAIGDESLRVVANFVDKERGFYWDITAPEKYFDLLRYYSPGDSNAGSASKVKWEFFPPQSQNAAFNAIRNAICSTKGTLLIADNYVDKNLWKLLISNLNRGISVSILSKKFPPDFALEAETVAQQYGLVLDVVETSSLHDRFIICDRQLCWHLGASIKDFGEKPAAIAEITGQDVVDAVSNVLESLLHSGSKIYSSGPRK